MLITAKLYFLPELISLVGNLVKKTFLSILAGAKREVFMNYRYVYGLIIVWCCFLPVRATDWSEIKTSFDILEQRLLFVYEQLLRISIKRIWSRLLFI